MQNDKYLSPQPPPGGPQGYPPQQGYPAQNYGPPPAQHYGPPPPQPYGPPPPQSYGPPPPQPYGPPPPQQYGPPPGHGFQPPPQGYPAPPPQHYGTAPPQTTTTVTAVVVQPNGWYSRNQRNKPQSNAAGAASLIFMSGGMNIAWSVGFRSFYYFLMPKHTILAWFIGGIIGAVLSTFLVNKVPKRVVLVVGSVLVMVAGVVRAATKNNVEAIEASLYLDGIANGLAFAPSLALMGEVAIPSMRGMISATQEQMSFMLGFFIQIIYVTNWTDGYYTSFTSEQMHGVLSAIYGLIAVIIASLLCIESPVIALANGDERGAIDLLRRLQRPSEITNETYAQLEEHKKYLAQNKDLSVGQSIARALPPFMRLAYLRILNAMSLSTLMYYALLITVIPSLRNGFLWKFVVFGACRWVGAFIVSLSMESLGRKKPTLLGLLVVGGFSFGIGSMLDDFPLGPYTSMFPLLCIIQFFAGFAFTGTSTYLTESYPLGVKQHFISFTFIAELLVFIIIGATDLSQSGQVIFFYIFAVLCVLGFIAGIFVLPETRGTTLREAQSKSTGVLNQGF